MSDVAMKERLLLGAFAFFIEAGTTVDGQTVSASIKPDATPLSNWPNLGAIENSKFEREEDEEEFLEPRVQGGYDKPKIPQVVNDYLILTTNHTSEFFHRLQMGLASPIVPGTAQAPHVETDRKITGWLKIQFRKKGGSDSFVFDWFCEMRLSELPDITNKTLRPALKFRRLASDQNTVVFPIAA